MKKINFVNNQAPAINAANLNQLQTNVENAITHEHCFATISSSQTIDFDTLYQNKLMNFDTLVSKQGNFTLENGQIKIGAGISKVKVTYVVNVSNVTTDSYFTIQSSLSLLFCKITPYTTYTATYIKEVFEGDTIYVGFGMQQGTTNSIKFFKSGNYIANTLLVEKIA